jgi:protein-tyrosine phosphatase
MNNVYRILMVCMGNICRSPTAEGVLRAKLAQAGLGKRVLVDSAGTHNYHPGSPPDERSQAHALRRGYNLSALRARPVCAEDYDHFDLILAMDWDNLALLQEDCPPEHMVKLMLLMEFAVPVQAAPDDSLVSTEAAGRVPAHGAKPGASSKPTDGSKPAYGSAPAQALGSYGAVVPDPYHGGAAGFEQVLDLVEAACSGLVRHVQRCLGQA